MRKTRKIIAILVVTVILNSALPMIAMTADKLNLEDIAFGETEDFGIPLRTDYVLKVAVSNQGGTPIALTVCSGSPAMMNVVNLNTGEVIDNKEVHGNTYWQIHTDSKGNIWFGNYDRPCTLYKYIPTTKELKDYGEIPTGATALISMTFDSSDNVYLGTYPSATVVRFNPETEEFTSLGKIVNNGSYTQSLAIHENTLFVGEYGPNTYKYNLVTGKKEQLPAFPDGTVAGQISRLNIIGGKYLAVLANDKLFFYDLANEKWMDTILSNVNGQYVTPEKDGLFYYKSSSDGDFYSCEISTLKTNKLNFTAPHGSYIRGGNTWISVNHPDLPGLSYVNAQYNGNIYVINFETKKSVHYGNMLKGAAASIRNIGFGPDNRLYVTEYMGTKGAAINIKTRDIDYFHMSQAEGFSTVGDKMVFGNYSNAEIYVLDPYKEFDYPRVPSKTDENPYVYGPIGEEQDRPFTLIEAEGLAIIGSVPTYGKLGGALTIFDPKTNEKEVFRNLIPEQSITGLCYKDGIIYGSSSISPGLNISPSKTHGEIFKFDLKTRKLISSVVPEIKSLSKPVGGIGDVVLGPDGLLWAKTTGVLIALDPNTLKTVKELKLNEDQAQWYTQYWMPQRFIFDDNGIMYLSDNGKLKLVNPQTLEYRDTDISCSNYLSMSPDGDLYTYMNTNVYCIPLFNTSAPKELMRRMTVMMTGKSDAYVGYLPVEIDKNDKTVVPFTENGRTMLPVRFLGESIGAEVSWNDAEQTAELAINEKTVKVPIGSDKIYINDKETKIDVPAKVISGRTYLPLRAIAEALGKEVVWDDRGLILIYDTGENIEVKDSDKTAIINMFE